MRCGKRLEPHAALENPRDRRVGSKIEPVALGIDDLGHKGNVGKTGCLPVTEPASPSILGEKFFERLKTRTDPVVVPDCDRRLVMTELMDQVAQHS